MAAVKKPTDSILNEVLDKLDPTANKTSDSCNQVLACKEVEPLPDPNDKGCL